MMLTKAYLHSEPPGETHIRGLVQYGDQVLQEAFSDDLGGVADRLLVGTGGTVTTLAAMMHGVDTEEISPERLNGLTLKAEGLQDVFECMRTMTLEERLTLPGLDQGRADVILAGTLAVTRIMHFFKAHEMQVSLSDLLEGGLIAYLEGGENEESGH
jgi:exopolyphosphatase/guanosine-5'-triphosphate,3'-diphosphate pyrophosphatase